MDIKKVEGIKASIRSGYYEGFVYPSDLVYWGGLYKKRPHGEGMIILPNGEHYQYQFDNGKLVNGKGIVVYPDGSFYEGEVSGPGKPRGQGIVRNPDGSTFFSGVWNHNYDPKIIWICGPPVEYARGEVFQLPVSGNIYSCNQILHPAVLLRNTEDRSSKYGHKFAYVMFPHLQEARLPNSENSFRAYMWTNRPREAILLAGFYDVENYVKTMICPDAVLVERLLGFVKFTNKLIEYKILPLDESFGSKALEFALDSSEKCLEIIQEDMKRSLGRVIHDLVEIINNYYC